MASMSMTIACAKGSTTPSRYGGSVSGTAAVEEGDGEGDGDGEAEDGDDDASVGSTSGDVEDPPASSDDGTPAESSDGSAESNDDAASSDEGFAESSEDDGANGPPSSAWEECNASGCEEGSDCVGVDGLRAFASFCAPQCEVAEDCFGPDDGDAVPICAIDAGGAGESTHCALVCEVDGDPFGECPAGMFCIDLPGQPTPVSLCMWP